LVTAIAKRRKKYYKPGWFGQLWLRHIFGNGNQHYQHVAHIAFEFALVIVSV
jgi:hypothetical protein